MNISRVVMALSITGALIACGNPKHDAAQKLYALTTQGSVMQAAFAPALASTPTPGRAAGSLVFSGACAGGGTASLTIAGTSTSTGTSSGSGNFAVTTTLNKCAAADGSVYDTNGQPLTFNITASGSATTTGGTLSANFDVTYGYDGTLNITGTSKAAAAYNFTKANVTVKGSVSATVVGNTATSASSNVTVVVDGTAAINGASNTFSNETFTVSASSY